LGKGLTAVEAIDLWIAAFYRFLGKGVGYPHPVHPATVHLPIGLVFGAFIFILVALFFRRMTLASAARKMIILAFIFWFITVLFGLMDWRYRYGGAWLFFFKAKMILAGALFIILLLSLILGHRRENRLKALAPLYGLGFLAVVGLGFFGGQLTYSGKTPSAPKAFRQGEWLYRTRCAACHPCGGNVINTHVPIYRSPLTANLKLFQGWVRHPLSPMPPFSPKKLPGSKVKDLYEYITRVINTLGTG
jgi:cytochrome c6